MGNELMLLPSPESVTNAMMKKHNNLVVSRWIAIREMVGRLGRSPSEVLGYQTPLEVFTAHITESVRIDS
jgi:hypothetical protein